MDWMDLAALEARISADLQMGRHREVIAELEGEVTETPSEAGDFGRIEPLGTRNNNRVICSGRAHGFEIRASLRDSAQ